MPEVDPAYYDAIEEVVEERKDESEWEADEMRSALMEVARGESQSSAAEDRDFSQPLLSKRWKDVDRLAEELKERREGESGLWRDPVEEAVENFEGFFEEMNEKFDMGVNRRVIQMMVDEIKDAGQLPAPMYVHRFLKGTNSGVQGHDVDYIKRRYEQWLEKFKSEQGADPPVSGGMSGYGGPQIQQGQNSPPSTGPGMSGGGGASIFPDEGGQQQSGGPPAQQQQGWQGGQQGGAPQSGGAPQNPQGPRDPRVDELMDRVEEMQEFVKDELADDDAASRMVTIDDGEQTLRLPVEEAEARGYLDGDGGEDFLDKIEKAKRAGIIPDQDQGADDDGRDLMETVELLKEMGVIDDGGDEEFASAIGEAIESLGEKQMQAQQQMSQNFQTVLQEIKGMQEEDDGDLTAEEVKDIINEELKEDEVSRLERRLEEMQSNFESKLDRAATAAGDAPEDVEFLKKDREMQFRENQLDMINDQLQRLPKEMALSVREGLVPALKELQNGGGAGGSPLWDPPERQGGAQPNFTPSTVQQQGGGSEDGEGYPSPSDDGGTPRQSEGAAEGGPRGADARPAEEYGEEVREKLNLGGDAEQEEVEA